LKVVVDGIKALICDEVSMIIKQYYDQILWFPRVEYDFLPGARTVEPKCDVKIHRNTKTASNKWIMMKKISIDGLTRERRDGF